MRDNMLTYSEVPGSVLMTIYKKDGSEIEREYKTEGRAESCLKGYLRKDVGFENIRRVSFYVWGRGYVHYHQDERDYTWLKDGCFFSIYS